MENRSHALIAGLFTLGLVVAAAIALLWLNQDRGVLVPYDLVTVESVEGLSPQADVKYRGLNVGKVESIGFDPNKPGQMLIRIGVREGTPMTDNLIATIEMKGITGVAFVDLDDNGKPGTPLVSTPSRIAQLQVQPGTAERLLNEASSLVTVVKAAADELRAMLSTENREAVHDLLANGAEAAKSLDEVLKQAIPTLHRLDPLFAELEGGIQEAGTAAREAGALAQELRQVVENATTPDGLIGASRETMLQLQQAVARLSAILPDASASVDDVGQAATTATRVLQQVERSPQSLIFGPAPIRPGPGEPGFTGFSHP